MTQLDRVVPAGMVCRPPFRKIEALVDQTAAVRLVANRLNRGEHGVLETRPLLERLGLKPRQRMPGCPPLGDDITIIDVKTRKATVSIPVGRIPWGVVIDE
jgi:YVTN family beta-propeller protein